ncbi:MAG: efflux RND transporter permease subunit, partial [Myxococcota bacterium]
MVLFRPSRNADSAWSLERLGALIGQVPARRPILVLVVASLMVAGAMSLAPQVGRQFFPSGDRDQVVFEIELAHGVHLSETDKVAAKLERAIMTHPKVENVASFIGNSTPPFYYNLVRRPQSPYVAQFLIDLTDDIDPSEMVQWGRDYAARELAGVVFVARKLEQGPPVKAPVDVRIYAEDWVVQAELVQAVYDIVAPRDDVRDVRHTMSMGAPVLELSLDDASAARRGITRQDLALTILGRTRGLEAGTLWRADEPVPIKVRSTAGENLPIHELLTLNMDPRGETMLPLETVAKTTLEMRPAEINRRNRRRLSSVRAELAPGASFAAVQADIKPQLDALFEGRKASYSFGGASEGSGQANNAIFIAAPLGMVVLLLVLLAQFRSFRRVGMVLLTVPLAAAGVIPGLLLAGQPFGFMSLLGVFSLIGIVVNNAIILIDFIDQERLAGVPMDDALKSAVEIRLRPILLTTTTTIIGLLPLLISSSTLWPPLASALISGLLGSTLLTVFVVPAAYRLLFRDNNDPNTDDSPTTIAPPTITTAAAGTTVLLLLCAATPSLAQDEPATLTLDEALTQAQKRGNVQAAQMRQESAEVAIKRARGEAWMPTLTGQGEWAERDETRALVTPAGNVPFEPNRFRTAAVVVQQPLVNLSAQLYQVGAEQELSKAAGFRTEQLSRDFQLDAAVAYLQVLEIDANLGATRAFIDALVAQRDRVAGLLDAGRALKVDLLRIEVQLAQARQQELQLKELRGVAQKALGQTVGASGPVEPAAVNIEPDALVLADDSTEPTFGRPEIKVLDANIASLGEQRRGLVAEALPTLSLEGAWIWTPDAALVPEEYFEAKAVISWTPFAGAARIRAARSLDLETAALNQERSELLRSLDIERASDRANLRTALANVDVQRTSLVQAEESARITRLRYAEGRSTLTDLLEVEAQLRDSRARYDVALLQSIRYHLAAKRSSGLPITLPGR